MAVHLTATSVSSGVEIFKGQVKNASGGFCLDDSTLTADADVLKGTVVGFDEVTRVATVVKQAILYENASNTAVNYKVKKGHHFKVTDVISFVVGGAAKAIASITTTDPAYDTIGVGGGNTLGVAITAGEVLFEGAAAGTDTGALKVTPKGLLYEDAVAQASENISVVIAGEVYQRRLPNGACAAVVAALPQIIFSQSK
jgi:hypothetical protein